MKRIVDCLKGLAFLLFMAFIVYADIREPRIFILHSYSTDYSWVEQINQGIMKKLSQHPSYHVRWHYMDTKNHPDLSFRQRAGVSARYQIAEFKPDVLLAIDDDAQAFVSKFYLDTPGIKIVYTGVNTQTEEYGFDVAQNVTGVLERLPLKATKEFMQLICPPEKTDSIKIIHIGDTSNTVKADERNLFQFDWAPLYFLDSILVETFDEWKQAVLRSQERADFLYITNYRKLYINKGSKSYVSPNEVMRWTVANSKVPIVGGNRFVVEDGAYMAIATSPFEQGRIAMEMVQSLLEGKPVQDIPLHESQEFLVVLRRGYPQTIPWVYQSFAHSMDCFVVD